MSYSLNPYNGFIDTSSEKGIKLMHKALEDFDSEHKGKINLEPEYADFWLRRSNRWQNDSDTYI